MLAPKLATPPRLRHSHNRQKPCRGSRNPPNTRRADSAHAQIGIVQAWRVLECSEIYYENSVITNDSLLPKMYFAAVSTNMSVQSVVFGVYARCNYHAWLSPRGLARDKAHCSLPSFFKRRLRPCTAKASLKTITATTIYIPTCKNFYRVPSTENENFILEVW